MGWATPAPPIGNGQDNGDIDFVNADLDSDSRPWKPTGARPTGQRLRGAKFEVEQLFSSPGTLRKARQQPPGRATAISRQLSKVPRSSLDAPTSECQELRRKLVHGAVMVFISAGYQGKRFIFERAAALGVKSVIIDHPDSWSQALVAEGVAAKFLPVDMSQSSDEVFNAAANHISNLANDGLIGPADGITTFVELSVPLAARLCEEFGLPSIGSEAVDAARDKHRTRQALKAAGLPTPRNVLIHNDSELEAAGHQVGFPAVLKPVSGAASLGVKKVESMQDLRACYQEVVAELATLIVSSGALVKADAEASGVNANEVVDLTLLLEQYLDGNEVDVDIVMSGGQWQYAAVSDNGPTMEPYFNETWGLCPSLLPTPKQRALKELAINSVQALGFASGVFHVELKSTSTGPQLIEVNARMGGGPVRECNRLVWGVDLVEEALFCAFGIPARPVLPAVPNICVGYNFINAQRSGMIRSTRCFEELRTRDGVVSSDTLVKLDDKVVGPRDGLPTWLCLLVVSRPSSREALDYIFELEKALAVEIDETSGA